MKVDNTTKIELQLFPPLDDFCLLQTYQIYSTEHAGWFAGQHADMTLRLLSWSSVVAMGAKKELDMLWRWQLENRGHCRNTADAVFELHILGDYKVLGLQFGCDGTRVIYLSSVDLSQCDYFYDPIATLIETGDELTAEQLS